MGKILNNERIVERAIKSLTKLDTNSKKKIIIHLTESIEPESSKKIDINTLYGAWEDSRDSDEIIREIRESRVNYSNSKNPAFE